MNTLLFTLLLTTAVPDDLTVAQFLEMLENTSQIYDNTKLVYQDEGKRLPEFESEEDMEEYLENTSQQNSNINESYKDIALKGYTTNSKTLVLIRDYDTYRKESISKTDITNMVFIMNDDLEYIYDYGRRKASVDHRSYRTRYGISFLRFERFREFDENLMSIEGNQISLINKDGELYYTLEFDIKENRIIPEIAALHNDRGRQEYYYKNYDIINGHYLPRTVEVRSYRPGYINNERRLTNISIHSLIELKPLKNIDDSEFDILLPPGAIIEDQRTPHPRKEYTAKAEDGDEKVSLVEFVKNLDEGEK